MRAATGARQLLAAIQHMSDTCDIQFHFDSIFFPRILFSLFVCFVFGRHLFVLVADQQLLFSIIIDTLNM